MVSIDERKIAMRGVLEDIRPVNTLELVRQLAGIAEFSKPFGDYLAQLRDGRCRRRQGH